MGMKVDAIRETALEVEILTAFRHAYEAGRFDVAEYLLCALESLQHEPRPGDALCDAYFVLESRPEISN